jgi:hypothetical protein
MDDVDAQLIAPKQIPIAHWPKQGQAEKRDTMNKKQTIMLSVAGAALAAVSQAQAQITYNTDDILLFFRDTASSSKPDLEVDLGPASALAGDSQSPNGTVVVSASTLTGAYGAAPSSTLPIGFTAAGADANTDEVWMTRSDSAAGKPTTYTFPQQQSSGNVSGAVANIVLAGQGAQTDATGNPTANSATLTDGDSESYHSLGEQNSGGQAQVINWGNNFSLTAANGGNIETKNTGSTVYEALWDIPASDAGEGSPVYLGYFTFRADGEVDFSAVPEPSTYGVLAAAGLLALALRRQFCSFTA